MLYQAGNATDRDGDAGLVTAQTGRFAPSRRRWPSSRWSTRNWEPTVARLHFFGDAGVGYEYVVAYVVRGRNPSAQDGIWRATITPAHLQ